MALDDLDAVGDVDSPDDSSKSDLEILNEDSEEESTESEETEAPADDEEEEPAEEGATEDEADEKEEKQPVAAITGRPSFKEVKDKFPELFKTFPGLRDAFFREQQFSNVFSSVEEAETAAQKSNSFDVLEASLVSGDPSLIFSELGANNPDALRGVVNNFLPTLEKMSRDLYVQATFPVLQDLIRGAYEDGKRQNDKNLMYAAGHLAKHIFGEARIPERRVDTGPHPAEVQLREERSRHFNERLGAFDSEVQREAVTSLEKMISGGIKDPDGRLTPFMRKTVTKAVLEELDQSLASDQQLAKAMTQLWRRAATGGFTKEHKASILNAHLARAKQLLPGIRNRLVSEALGKAKPGANNHSEKRQLPEGGRQLRSTGKMPPAKDIDWSQTSDLDILNGKVTRKR